MKYKKLSFTCDILVARIANKFYRKKGELLINSINCPAIIQTETYLLFIKLLFLHSQSLFRLIFTFILRFAHVVNQLRSSSKSPIPGFCSSPAGFKTTIGASDPSRTCRRKICCSCILWRGQYNTDFLKKIYRQKVSVVRKKPSRMRKNAQCKLV